MDVTNTIICFFFVSLIFVHSYACSQKKITDGHKHPAKHVVVEYTEKSQEKQESRHVQLVREYGFHPRSKVQVEDGGLLPRKFEPFPSHMYGKPLEEIDQFIYEEVSKQPSFITIYCISFSFLLFYFILFAII